MPEANISEPVGKVIVLSGSATAQSSTGERLLKVGDPVFKNDIIKTDAGSKVQIRFADNTQVSQAENSTLSIDKFVYNPDPADNSDLLLNMMKGTFRTITGEITKDSPTNFMLKSPQSTIGIRGTIVVSEVTSLYEKHGVSELTPGKILVITDNYGNVRIIKVPMKIVEFFKGKPVSEVRDLLLKELEEINEKTPLDLGEKDTPLGYTPPDDFMGGLDQGVDILGADVVPSDFGLTGNMVLFSTEGPGLLGVFDNVDDIPGYDPNSGPGDKGGPDGSNENVIPGVNNYTLSENQVTQDETDDGNITYTFTVTRTGDTENASSLDWNVVGSGANPADADDFGGALPSGTLAFNPNTPDGKITITVSGDTDFEFDESFSIILSDPDGGTIVATSGDIIIQNDDDPISDYVVSATDTVQDETDTGDISYTFTVTRTGDTEASSSVAWGVEGTGANPANANDFGGALPSGTLNFAAGQTTQDITVSVSGDTDFEFDESFSIALSNPDGSGPIAAPAENVIIQNDDPAIFDYAVTATEAMQDETDTGNISYTFTVTRTGDTEASSSVAWGVEGTGANPANANDFGGALPSGTLNFAAGQTTQDITVSVSGDTDFEFDESFSIALSNPDGSGPIAAPAENVIIQNDDPAIFDYAVTATEAVQDETDIGNIFYTFSVTRTGDTETSSSVVWGVEGTGANPANANDFGGALPSGTLNFAAGQTTQDITVSVSGDTDFEFDEEFSIILSYPGTDGTIITTSANAIIQNNDSPHIMLAELDGTDGFRVDGIGYDYDGDYDDNSGWSVSNAGDVNGDGFDDFIIGAYGADPGGTTDAGESYVVFGGVNGIKDWESPELAFDLNDLNGSNGFKIEGRSDSDYSGRSVSAAGDLNGDGYADLIIGANGADIYGGESYVILGGPDGVSGWEESEPQSELNLNDLGYEEGFRIVGIDEDDNSGWSVSNAGDVNGDGFGDLIIGAYQADGVGNLYSGAGESYLVFGGTNGFWGRTEESSLSLDELNGSNGIKIYAPALASESEGIDQNGYSVSNAGDINADGYDDFLIGAYDYYTGFASGESYLVFGGENGIQGWDEEGDSFSLGSLNGENGFQINGISNSLSNAGDINGDGFDDFIIGAFRADPGESTDAGESYVVFGGANGVLGWEEANNSFDISSLNGENGFSIAGIDSRDYSGVSVSTAGDMNGDGFDDFIIGAFRASPDGNIQAGESYLVFGGENGVNGWSTSNSNLNLDELDGLNGFSITGIDPRDYSGYSVSSAGDINGDGFNDLIIGAYGADPDDDFNAGESYILFGMDFTGAVDELGSADSEIIIGTTGADNMIGGLGDDSMLGLGGPDVMYGGAGNDLINVSDFFRVDGGSGFDTLQIDGTNLNTIPSNKIQGIERIDLGFDDSANNLTLSMSDVLDMSDTTNTLVIDGDGNDTFSFSDGRWASSDPEASDFQGGEYPEDFDPENYDVYTNGQATLYVDTDLTNLTFTEAVVA